MHTLRRSPNIIAVNNHGVQVYRGAWGGVVVSATSRRVPESIPGQWGFFPEHQTVPCALGSTQHLKMSTRIFLGVKTAGA